MWTTGVPLVLTHCQMKCQDGYEFIGGSSGDPSGVADAEADWLIAPAAWYFHDGLVSKLEAEVGMISQFCLYQLKSMCTEEKYVHQ